jgi:glycosyl transferase family 87
VRGRRVSLKPSDRIWLALIAAAGLLFLAVRYGSTTSEVLRGMNDFMSFYTGPRLVGTPDQFRSERYAEDELATTGEVSLAQQVYLRLPVFAYAMRPLTALPYHTAYFIWQGMSLAALAGFILLWPEPGREGILLAACWSIPLVANITNGQDVAFLLLFLAVFWRFHGTRPWLAGICLALCSLKFHLFLLVPLVLIAHRKWRVLAWAAAGVLTLLGLSTWVSISHWIPQFIAFVSSAKANMHTYAMPNLLALFTGLPHAMLWEIAGSVCVAALVVWLAARSSFSLALSASLVGGLLTSHHAYYSDVLLVLPALVLILRETTSMVVRLCGGLLLSPLPFLVIAVAPLVAPVPLLLVILLVALAFEQVKTSAAVTPSPHS